MSTGEIYVTCKKPFLDLLLCTFRACGQRSSSPLPLHLVHFLAVQQTCADDVEALDIELLLLLPLIR